jgi:uncharacterized repeat protein (TIGR01451 family)
MALLLRSCAVVSLLAVSMHVTAQDMEGVDTELIAEVLVETRDAANQPVRRFVPATVLSQGETVYYTLRIHNPTGGYLRNVEVIQRIPVNTAYIDQSAAAPGAEVTFSIDGGQSFAPREQLRYVDANGKTQLVSAQDYTHIKFRLRHPLAPGAVALARFRARFQ